MITDETVERVREAADILQIIGEHVKLKRVGASYRGPCPFHQGTNANFSVVPSKGIYKCFVCGESGDVFTYLQKRLGMEFPEAVKYVAEKSGIVVEEVQRRREVADPRQPFWELNATVADWFRQQLWDDRAGEEARNYLSLRRVSRDVADRFGLGFAPRDPEAMREFLNAIGTSDEQLLEAGLLVRREETGELRPRFRNRLIFPIQDAAGNYVGFGGRLLGPGEPKYLNSAESPVFSKGRLLYGLHLAKHAIRKDDRVMVVEGYFDVVRLVSAGFDWVVAPLGTALTEDQAALLRRYAKHAYLLYDNDLAGLKATFRSGDQLLRQKVAVQVVTLPAGEDPDSFVDKYGGEKLAEQLSGAIDIFERKVQELQRGGWFADLRKKRVAIDKLLPTLRATADDFTREIYLARASEVSAVSRQVLEREVAHMAPRLGGEREERGANRSNVRPAARQQELRMGERRQGDRRHTSEPPPSERALLRILLHDRGQVEMVAEQIGPEHFTDAAAADIFRALLATDADAPLAQVAEQLSMDSVPLFQELQEDSIGEGFDAQSELKGSIARVRVAPIERRLREIDAEMRIAQGAEMDQLISEKHRLRAEKVALGGGRFRFSKLDNP